MRILIPGLFPILLASCGTSKPPVDPPATAAQVEVSRYTGRWHEVARLPAPFQKANESAIAEYGLNASGTLSVRNIAVRPDGSERDIKGSATILNPPANTKLDVRFETWFARFIPDAEQGNYWILHVDSRYQEAIVGTPNWKYLWVLTRSPNIPEERRQALVKIAKDRGYDVSKLIHHRQSPTER